MLVFFLIELLNWHDIFYECTSEATCAQIHFVRPDWGNSSAFRVLAVFYYCFFFTAYWLWTLLQLR